VADSERWSEGRTPVWDSLSDNCRSIERFDTLASQPVSSRAVSPSTLRRYRAERLLRQEFGGLREEVLGSVRGRLRARGVQLDRGDLEACYAVAWQGLYAAVAAGEEVANPAGWLTVVTFRRAIDEHRSVGARLIRNLTDPDPARPDRVHVVAGSAGAERAAAEPDWAAELDDRARLRQLFEALRGRLNARECEAASLCYLQGLTRAQAAERMGISEARMGKLMEGRGPDRPGVAGKVGELLEAIRGGEWCEQQGSLMRGLAFGILDPGGERYRLARLHQRECPACRAYVLSLRGLAAVLPPLPLPWGLGTPPTLGAPSTRATPTHAPPTHAKGAHAKGAGARGAGAKAGAKGAGAKAGAGTGASAGTGAASAGTGAGAVSASGVAGVGGAGGGWLLGGSVGAKLAVTCVLALSVGCVALTVAPHHAGASTRRRLHREAPARSAYVAGTGQLATGSTPLGGALVGRPSTTPTHGLSRAARAGAAHRVSTERAQREFGPEQLAAGTTVPATGPASVTARAASRRPQSSSTAGEELPTPAPAGPPSHAEREFGPE
jgi:DNA-directed RNA polymerase specialized sigma24 family protein